LKNARFGFLTLDRDVNWFDATTKWAGVRVTLHLSIDNSDQVEQPLSVSTKLWDAETAWNSKILDYAAQELLPLKNNNGLEDGESKLNAIDFKSRMTPEEITVYPEGRFEFYYNDGDMFGGHVILVSGSLSNGLDDAGIHG
jgi:hypothetical protein